MTPPIVTPRAEKIAEDLLADARAFLAEQGAELHSRQVEALARAVARRLAALEDLFFLEPAIKAEFSDYQKTLSDISAAPTPLRDAAVGLAAPPATLPQPRMLIVQRWDREAPENVAEGEIRWGQATGTTAGNFFKWALCATVFTSGSSEVPYVRRSSDSPWGVRVEILGEGR